MSNTQRTVLVVTNLTGTETQIVPGQQTNLTISNPASPTVLSAMQVGPALSGPQGIQGIRGNTGATGATGATGSQGIQGIQGIAGISGYGYTGAVINGDYLYISQIDPNGVIGTSYSLGYIRGKTGPTGPVESVNTFIGNIGITGTTNEILVTNSNPNIVIGISPNINIDGGVY